MNTKQQNALRSLLKKYQYKNVSNMVRMALGINYEVFLQKAEPLYVIPRIASCYADDSDVKNCLNGKVYKEWLDMVVSKRWVKPINDYIDQYGAHIVLGAMYYLINNNLWESYEGRLSLDASEPNYYDKLEDMPSAIAMMQEADAESEKQQGSDGTPPQGSDGKVQQGSDGKVPQGSDGKVPQGSNDQSAAPYIKDAGEASVIIYKSVEIAEQLKHNLDRLSDYIYTAADTDVLRKKIDEQQKQLEAQKEQHQKEITALQQQLDEQKAKAADANATMLKASDYIAKQKEEAKEAQKQYDELNAKYKKALDERDAADRDLAACKKLLDEEAAHEQLPKKKVIPYSVLDAVPLLGKGVMTGLVPVLARYNIVVDYNR